MPHGLSSQFFDDLTRGGLSWLTERVRQDHTLDLEIRADQIQVYYRGGRLMHDEHCKVDARRVPSFEFLAPDP